MVNVPNVILNSGHPIPILGLGTDSYHKGEVVQAVKDAIDIGYRHIDCAYVDQNEDEVGEGVEAKINEGVVKREDLFITSKLWNTFHRPDLVRGACETTLKNLKLSYVDMYLMHWPMGFKEGDELYPTDEAGKNAYSDIDYVDTWKAMEKLVQDGLVKSIGISNFNKSQIERILAIATIPPATNQIECHPYLNQKELMEYCKSKKIAITAYKPLGSVHEPGPRIEAIAEKYKKTSVQILIRYQIQRGNIVIPKSVTKSHIASNFDVFNFELSADDMRFIDSFDCNRRLSTFGFDVGTHQHYPFHDEF